MRTQLTACWSIALLLVGLTACSGGSTGNPNNRGDFKLSLMSTGQGQIYPYRIRQLDSQGVPSTSIVNVESMETLRTNVSENNGVLPVATFPTTPVLPNGASGNQFLLMEFTHELDVTSILSDSLANSVTNSGLTTAIALVSYDPNTEQTRTLRGRGFVGGQTYFNDQGQLVLVDAVTADEAGEVSLLDGRASGFPMGFTNDEALVRPNSFVFVADTDGDLDTIERFDPQDLGILIRIQVTNAVRDTGGQPLEFEVVTATTVGEDASPPEVLGFSSSPVIVPGNGQDGVDPQTQIQVTFNKPVQPYDVGRFLSSSVVPELGGIAITSTIQSRALSVLYYAEPRSFGDLVNYTITPAYNLPGRAMITVGVGASSIRGLAGEALGRDISTTFETGAGPGIVNAPVAPDAVYLGVGGATPGISVIDLNGFGQGTNGLEPDPVTGEPTKDPSETNFARNPNIGSPNVLPQLSVGQGPLDAGSNGSLTLVEDTSGNTLLLSEPIVGQIGDIHLGPPLDLVYNNLNVNVYAGDQNHLNPLTGTPSTGNVISAIPHPNPPKLAFPPPNLTRGIFGEEPTVTTSTPGPQGTIVTAVPPCRPSPVNRLVGGATAGFYPHLVEGVFNGPQPAPEAQPQPPRQCPFSSRQQIGHFLYALDRENRQIVVVNSNRFTVLDTIRLNDPVAMSISPNLGVLAVASFESSSILFIDIDPRSVGFNTVVAETRVPDGPSKIAWQPDGEHLLAVSYEANSLSVLSGGDFTLHKVISGNIARPIDIAVTERYQIHGNASGVYYAYILNENGSVTVYESGPSGVNGIGFEDVIGTVDLVFRRARRLKLNYTAQMSGFYVAHVDEGGVGQVSTVELTATPVGPFPTQQLNAGFILPPTFRQKTWEVTRAFGGSDPSVPDNERLSGNSPIDICADEMLNFGGLPNQRTPFNGTRGVSVIGHSSKGSALTTPNGIIYAYRPRFLFVALGDVGRVDVIDLNSQAVIRTIDVPGVQSLSTYWKQ